MLRRISMVDVDDNDSTDQVFVVFVVIIVSACWEYYPSASVCLFELHVHHSAIFFWHFCFSLRLRWSDAMVSFAAPLHNFRIAFHSFTLVSFLLLPHIKKRLCLQMQNYENHGKSFLNACRVSPFPPLLSLLWYLRRCRRCWWWWRLNDDGDGRLHLLSPCFKSLFLLFEMAQQKNESQMFAWMMIAERLKMVWTDFDAAQLDRETETTFTISAHFFPSRYFTFEEKR